MWLHCIYQFQVGSSNDRWYVTKFEAEHNHELVPMNQVPFIRSHRDITDADSICIKSLIKSDMKPSITMRNIAQSAGGLRHACFLTKDLYNACEKFKKEEIKDGDTKTVLAYLLGKTASDPSFFVRYTRDNDNGIDKMFWCDGICQANYKAFGTVVAFDATYKVNSYHKPFVVIVGVNHHRKTVPLAVALIANEKTETYVWVLQLLLEVGGNIALYTVVDDGDKAMANAIKIVFPNARHRICLWHLMRNIKGHTDKIFCSGFMKCVDGSWTPSEFEESWEDLMKAYLGCRDKKWAKDLYNDKEKWAEAYMHGHFYAGMRSTQRCESMNNTLKVVITNKILLYRFVELYDQVLEHVRFEEDKDDYTSTHTYPVITGVLSGIKNQTTKTYTRNAYNLFCKALNYESRHIVVKKKEQTGYPDDGLILFWLNDCVRKDSLYVVCYSPKQQQMTCCCMKLESIGIPCRNMFAVMKYSNMDIIPRGRILCRWTIKAKDHLSESILKQTNLKRENDATTSNGRFAFLTGLSNQLCRLASTSYDRSIWLKDKLAKLLLELEREKMQPKEKDIVPKSNNRRREKKDEVKTPMKEPIRQRIDNIDDHVEEPPLTNQTAPTPQPAPPTKPGGFVELSKQFKPRTYNAGEAAQATDNYEVSKMEKIPTIFKWNPSTNY